MEARMLYAVALTGVVASMGASYRTANFVVDAPTPHLAREIGDTAEIQRRDLAIEWLGKPMPNWAQPCLLTAQVAPNLGAGGATSFVFEQREVFGWRMTIQGSRERILDSVLPHEITHTVFACHFRQALPRWADEGACTTVEHASERIKQERMLITFLQTGRGISFSRMFAMTEYPADVMPLYSQGYSLARFLMAQGGKRKFLEFVGTGLETENWTTALQTHYGYENLLSLQENWLGWVRQGSPELPQMPTGPLVAAAENGKQPLPESDLIYRAERDAQPSGPLVPVAKLATRPASQTPLHESPAQQQLARPLAPEKTRQTILQWDRNSPGGQQMAIQRNSVTR